MVAGDAGFGQGAQQQIFGAVGLGRVVQGAGGGGHHGCEAAAEVVLVGMFVAFLAHPALGFEACVEVGRAQIFGIHALRIFGQHQRGHACGVGRPVGADVELVERHQAAVAALAVRIVGQQAFELCGGRGVVGNLLGQYGAGFEQRLLDGRHAAFAGFGRQGQAGQQLLAGVVHGAVGRGFGGGLCAEAVRRGFGKAALHVGLGQRAVGRAGVIGRRAFRLVFAPPVVLVLAVPPFLDKGALARADGGGVVEIPFGVGVALADAAEVGLRHAFVLLGLQCGFGGLFAFALASQYVVYYPVALALGQRGHVQQRVVGADGLQVLHEGCEALRRAAGLGIAGVGRVQVGRCAVVRLAGFDVLRAGNVDVAHGQKRQPLLVGVGGAAGHRLGKAAESGGLVVAARGELAQRVVYLVEVVGVLAVAPHLVEHLGGAGQLLVGGGYGGQVELGGKGHVVVVQAARYFHEERRGLVGHSLAAVELRKNVFVAHPAAARGSFAHGVLHVGQRLGGLAVAQQQVGIGGHVLTVEVGRRKAVHVVAFEHAARAHVASHLRQRYGHPYLGLVVGAVGGELAAYVLGHANGLLALVPDGVGLHYQQKGVVDVGVVFVPGPELLLLLGLRAVLALGLGRDGVELNQLVALAQGGLHVRIAGAGGVGVGKLVDWQHVAVVVVIAVFDGGHAAIEGLVAVVEHVEVGHKALIVPADPRVPLGRASGHHQRQAGHEYTDAHLLV